MIGMCYKSFSTSVCDWERLERETILMKGRRSANPGEQLQLIEETRSSPRQTLRGFTTPETTTDVLLRGWSSSLLLQAGGDADTRAAWTNMQDKTFRNILSSCTPDAQNIWLLIQNEWFRRMTKLLLSIWISFTLLHFQIWCFLDTLLISHLLMTLQIKLGF